MAATLFSNTARVALRSGASATSKAGAAGLTFARGKATLPDLSCKSSILGPGEVQKGLHFGSSFVSVN
jgi:Fe-Mn family superoxide dismutase